ncbi:MAG: YfhO family protein [Planctomycetota bacterium]
METSPQPAPSAAPPGLAPREVLIALVAALVVFAWPVRGGLFDPDRVVFGVDTATSQLPWSAAIAADGAPDEVARPRNPSISDQGVVFYPFYLWVARSWLAGDVPAWNPDLYAGVPGIANPQSGALDPQVAPLVLLYKLGGRAAFDWGLSCMAWLRLAAAGLGAYLLARVLGLRRAPAALSGVAFGLSGYVVLWLNFSLGHVTPLLPWVLLGLERIRGPRPGLAMAGTSLALTAAVLGGHPETAFYVGAVAGVWALALLVEDRRAGLFGLLALALGTLAAAASLLPFVEYLELSGAKAIRDTMLAAGGLDLTALGGVLVLFGVGAWFARVQAAESGDKSGLGRHGVLGGVGFALAVGGMALVLRQRGLAPTAPLVLLPDLFGAPGSVGYRGEGSYSEVASGWIALLALGLALAAALSPTGVLRRRRLIAPAAAVALLLSIETPGVLDAYRQIPLIGLGATERLAAVGALMLALLAGEAVQAAPRAARLAAALTLALLGAGTLFDRDAAALPPELLPVVQEDELFGLTLAPPEELSEDNLRIEGWLHPSVPVHAGTVRVQKLDAVGRPIGTSCFSTPIELLAEPSEAARRLAPERVVAAPDGATFFRGSWLVFSRLDEGVWRFALDFMTEESGETPVATRVVAVSRVEHPRRTQTSTLALGVLALALLALLPVRPGLPWQLAALALVLAQGSLFARGINPAIPRAESFPETRTEAILAEILGPYRFFSERYVLPPDTGLVRGLAALDGYDGLDIASYNGYRSFCLPPGANALLGWNARNVLLESGAFRLLGVGALAMRDPLDHPGWELVAGPGQEREAETWIYRARDPLPRAFCVPAVVSFDELGALVLAGGWDPLQVACLGDGWRPGQPFTRSEVSVPEWTNNTVRLTAELDGDGLLVLTEQDFPGWEVTVNGEPREIATADAIFRGVKLEAGRHEVVFRYRPRTLRVGAAVSAAALLAIGVCFALGLRRRVHPGGPASA